MKRFQKNSQGCGSGSENNLEQKLKRFQKKKLGGFKT
jgi:hypothetical protein